MDRVHQLRELYRNGTPLPKDVPQAVRDFLANPSGSDSDSEDESLAYLDDENPRYFLEAFEFFPRTPPPASASAKTQIIYGLLQLALVSAREACYLKWEDSEMWEEWAGIVRKEVETALGDAQQRLREAMALEVKR
ncbi:hypothetical protein LXA43DRAFT_890657 [Ganoderma leucocontextum]|nr:hypothetical protein LXA43DRAFT_890657 [Ganoderma leucocontextum]